MSEPLKGEQVLITFDAGSGSFQPFACGRAISVNMTSDTAGISTVGSGNFKEYIKTALGWDFTIEGIVYLDVVGMLAAPTFYSLWLSLSAIAIEFTLGNEDVVMSGNALITGVTTTGSVSNVASMNITGLGTGELTIL